MQVAGTPPGTVYAIGDCADIKGQPLPCTAQVNCLGYTRNVKFHNIIQDGG